MTSKMSKLFFFDLETTGTLYWRHGIHQISGMIEIDGEIKKEFNFHVAPNPRAEIDPKALEVGGVTWEQINAYPFMREVYEDIVDMLEQYVNRMDRTDKFHLVGYNNRGFDDPFFRAFFVQNGDKYFGSWFWSDSIDVMVLASQYLMDRRSLMKDFKLSTVADTLGVKVEADKLHDALYDVRLTREIYKRIVRSR